MVQIPIFSRNCYLYFLDLTPPVLGESPSPDVFFFRNTKPGAQSLQISPGIMLRDGRNALQNRSLLLENQRFPFTWKAYFKKSLKGQETDVFFNIPPWPYTYLLDHTSKRKFANNHDKPQMSAPQKKYGAACVSSAAEQIAVFPPAERCDKVWRWHTSRQDLAWGLELMLVRIGDTVQWGQEATHKTGFWVSLYRLPNTKGEEVPWRGDPGPQKDIIQTSNLRRYKMGPCQI